MTVKFVEVVKNPYTSGKDSTGVYAVSLVLHAYNAYAVNNANEVLDNLKTYPEALTTHLTGEAWLVRGEAKDRLTLFFTAPGDADPKMVGVALAVAGGGDEAEFGVVPAAEVVE